MNCPNCFAPIDDDAKFCVYCGTKFENKSCCSQCGNIIVPGTKFCTCCGAKLQSISLNIQEEQKFTAKNEKAEQERLRKECEEAKKAEQERIRQKELQEERRRASIAYEEKRRMETAQEQKKNRITIAVILFFVLVLGGGILYFALSTKNNVSDEKTHIENSNASESDYEYESDKEYGSYESCDEEDDMSNYSESSSLTYIDLGLSVLWADRNIGASSVTDNGWLIGWGTTDYQNTSKKLNEYPTSNPPHSISQTNYDIAKAMYGGDWRLPHLEELKELKDECTWEVECVRGVNAYKVTGPNGNCIYLPFAGYRDGTELKREGTWGFIWSGELFDGNSQFAANLSFSIKGQVATSGFYRYGGESIRAVMSK